MRRDIGAERRQSRSTACTKLLRTFQAAHRGLQRRTPLRHRNLNRCRVQSCHSSGFLFSTSHALKTWGFTHCTGWPRLLSGLVALWAQDGFDVRALHRSLTFTTIVFPNGPVDSGELGSFVGVISKQRPQAPPKPPLPPNVSSFTAAEYPLTIWPQAGG
jgi:hypothetical protein